MCVQIILCFLVSLVDAEFRVQMGKTTDPGLVFRIFSAQMIMPSLLGAIRRCNNHHFSSYTVPSFLGKLIRFPIQLLRLLWRARQHLYQ
jgi:hypothetical protein